MKKLTAGIFSVLMGLVAVNAADAAVASKGYVTGQITAVNNSINTVSQDLAGYKTSNDAALGTLTQTVADNKTAAETAVSNLSNAVDDKLDLKQNKLNVTGGVLTWNAETSTLGLTGIATSDNLQTLQTTVNTLNGLETEEGSVKKQIADAIASEVTRSNQYADTAESDAITAANAYTDDREAAITTAYKAADQELQGLITANTNNFANYTTTTDMNAALALKEDVANKVNNSTEVQSSGKQKSELYPTLSYTETLITQNTNDAYANIGDMEALEDATGKTDLSAAVVQNKTAIDAINNETTGILATAKAAAKTETENQISALDLQAISRVPAECSEPTKYCALTTNGTNFVWEVIERDPSEFEADGTTLKSEGRTLVEGVTE